MNKFWGIFKKDLIVSRNILLVPVWITIGNFVLMAVSLIAYFKSGMNIKIMGMSFDEISSITQHFKEISYISNFSMVSFPGILAVLFVVALTGGALNHERRKKCEIFYRAQPISIYLNTLSKYISSIFGNLAIMLAISLLHYLVISIIMVNFIPVSWVAGFMGFLQGFLHFFFAILIIGSFGFLCSAIFEEKAFGKGLAILIFVAVAIEIINVILGAGIPSLFRYIGKLLFNSFSLFNQMDKHGDNFIYEDLVATNWRLLFSIENLVKVLLSAGFYFLATYIYKRKEIK